ncbi:MAG: hypothetical protein K1X36_06760 [Pyrinomonadaceae bacterium]|nr:hypothetical protein [Pyrinomonadaceae bacterium]
MTNELINLVAQLDRELIELYGRDTALFEELTILQRSLGIMHGDRPICPFLRPYFLGGSRYREIARAANILCGAFDAMTKAALESDELVKKLGLSPKEEQFARFEPGYASVAVTSRLDTFLFDGGFKFLEYNAENPAGIGDQSSLERLFTHIPRVRQFLAENEHFFPKPEAKLLATLDRAYREYGGTKAKPNIAIVDWAGVDTRSEFVILRDYFESKGYAAVIGDPESLEYDGHHLRLGNFEVDVFYKRVIIHEFLERYDENHPLSRAMADGNVCMANSFRCKLPHKKASLAILSDDRYHRLFSAAELQMIGRHIPWTRRVEYGYTSYRGDQDIDLIELIRAQPQRFVLKPNDDYGGKGIAFGWESSESDWDDAIEHAVQSAYIVQERADVERVDIAVFSEGLATIESLTVDFDPFLFMGDVEGGMVRLAAGSLVNITSGGGETALAVLNDH